MREWWIAASALHRQDQGGEDARFLAERPFGTFRGVANVDYLSSFVFRIAFTDVYTQAIDSEVRSQIFLSNTTNGFHFNALAERYQNFEVCDPRNGNEHLHHAYADGVGPDSAYAKFLPLRRGAAVGKYAAVLVVRERGRGFAARARLGSAPLLWWAGSIWRLRLRCRCNGRDGRSVPQLTLRDTFYTEQGNPANSDNRGRRHSESQVAGDFGRVAAAGIVAGLRSSLARTQMEARD